MIRARNDDAVLTVSVPNRLQERNPGILAEVAHAAAPFVEPDVRVAAHFDDSQGPSVMLHGAEGGLGPVLDRVCILLGMPRHGNHTW